MPPPKRPFTTSSLTSTLKSTIANQPLLSNFTSIDKLSSQASSLAHKTPFFGANQQLNHADNATSQNNSISSSGIGQAVNAPSTSTNTSAANMMRGGPMQQVGGAGSASNQPAQRGQALATTPTVDMSHLTEEERLMIQSVMAKAEMADMGMPVDTSVPSSTNLPSNASQALVQQQQQAKQQQQMSAHNNPQQRPLQPQQQQQPQQNIQRGLGQPVNQQDFLQQQQQQAQNMNKMNPNQHQGFNQGSAFNQNQQQFQQPQQQHQPQQPPNFQQNMQNQPINQQANIIGPQQAPVSSQANVIDPRTTIPSLEQQTQQLVNQINSQFNLNQNQNQNQLAQPTTSTSNQRNIQNNQQINPNRQFVSYDNSQTSNNQQQFQHEQQQQNLFDQQMRLQQIPSNNNLDQTLMMGVGGGGQTSVSAQQQQQQLNNPIISQQQYPSSEQRQIQQQAQLNQLVNEQQARLMQPNNQRTQLELEASANIDPLLQNQLMDPMQQQQQLAANNYQVNNPNPIIQRPNIQQQQANLSMLDSQMNPINTQLGPNFVSSQPTPRISNIPNIIDPSNQNMSATTNPFPSSAVNSQVNTNLNQQQLSMKHQQTPYNALCSEIRFGPQQLAFDHQNDQHNDHALSDQEYGYASHGYRNHSNRHNNIRRYESVDPNEHRNHSKYADNREPIDVRERNLQAYDLAQRNDENLNRHSPVKPIRQLPRPNQAQHEQHSNSNEQSNERQINNRNTNSRSREKPSGNSRKSAQESPKYLLSESDDEMVLSSEEKKATTSSRKSPSTSNNNNKDVLDKNEEAIRVLSELKLTEQANQVMEQQQLLIKQSQELIKLQLEQQALSQELKKSIKQTNISSTSNSTEQNNNNNKNQQKDNNNNNNADEEDSSNIVQQQQQQVNAQNQKSDEESRVHHDRSTDKMEHEDETNINKKSAVFYHHNDSEPESPHRLTSKATSSTRFNDAETDSSNRNRGKSNDRELGKKTSHLYQQNLTNSSSQTGPSLRYNRDLLQSPTDTTDSDVEPLSRSQDIRKQQKFINQQSSIKPKSVVRRREPTGLPPSPLPVAAAIQLHQMQQQHFKNQSGNSSSSIMRNSSGRGNFMRSRSVTSSPSYHLEQSHNSGYLTDNQRNRSASPDTLSEFGGQRRRKRLPEPPTNTVPITPSMVRKMIQAQRTGSSASGKLLTSVNAHSTLLTNTHSTRNLAFERLPNNHDTNSSNTNSTNFSRTNNEAYQSINQPNSLSQTTENTSINHPTTSTSGVASINSSQHQHQHQIPASKASSDLNKFLSSTYGNSILRNNISDVKETPELDKLISNLDEYYGLDASKGHHNNISRTLIPPPTTTTSSLLDVQLATDTSYNNNPSILSSYSAASPTRAIGSSTNYSINPSSVNYTNTKSMYPASSDYLMRRSSEGESNLARLTSRRPYRQANLDEGYRNYGRNFTSSSYLEGRNPSSYLSSSSPVRQLRYSNQIPTSERLNRDYPSTSLADHYLGSSTSSAAAAAAITNANKFDRNTSQYYRPNLSHLSANSRLHSNPTGSLDFENLDYLTPTTNDHRLPQSTGLSDVMGSVSSKYQQHHLPNVNPNIDLVRDKYRYSDYNDLSSRYDRNNFNNPVSRYQSSALTSTDFGAQRRAPMLSHPSIGQSQHRSFDLDGGSPYYSSRANLSPFETRSRDVKSNQYLDSTIDSNSYVNDPSMRHDSSALANTRTEYYPQTSYTDTLNRSNLTSSSFAPLTKSDIINNGPKFNSIGYRFRTENQNKYVAQARNPIQCLQSRYPHPYKRILLSKNPKDRIGNGIGVRIIGGQPIPNLYDKVNRCIVSSGAFVTEVFQNSNAHFMGEMQEGDQIIEWNGVNLCNRSNEEVQEILLSQFGDDEVEIVYLPQNKFNAAYEEINSQLYNDRNFHDTTETGPPDAFDTFADMNKSGRQSSVTPIVARSRYGDEATKGSIRRKLSLSHIAHMWSK